MALQPDLSRCGEVLVHPHDLVVADFDGVVVIPQAVVAQTLALAQEKMGQESLARQSLLAGKTPREVYDTYQVL